MSKIDEFLLKFNESIRTLDKKITPNVVLFVAMFNGLLIGLATTGYLGDNSIAMKSITFALIIWQFVLICFFSAVHVNLTAEYLNKFILSAGIGFSVQWQGFGMYVASFEPDLVKNIQPIIENNFGIVFGGYIFLLLIKYCFSGNESAGGKTELKYTTEEGA